MKYILILLSSILLLNAPARAAQTSECAGPAPTIVTVFEYPTMTVRTEGRGPIVILIPGLATPRAVWDNLAASLRKCYSLHIVQLRGFGDAPNAKTDGPILEAFVADLAKHIDRNAADTAAKAAGAQPPIIIGHSLGGLAAMKLSLGHPNLVKRAMVVDSLPFFGLLFGPSVTADTIAPQAAAIRDALAARPTYQADERTLQSMSINAAGRDQVSAWSATADPKTTANMLYDVMTADIRPQLAKLAVPMTILYPSDASVAGAERADALYQSAYSAAPAQRVTLKRIDDSRHFIMLDQPQKFLGSVTDFLNEETIPLK